ncbi:kinesin klpA protein [Rutstroemia sp. NJR-2017a BBW]|nr:kinesin klpA protein [Rutstroemia sp. NJR-2017a BBW]
MDFQEENQYARTSHIKPPTARLTSPNRGLSEMSDSNSNSRARFPPSKMPQPTTALKRFGEKSNNEPEPKRKTLAERAGEPISGLARTPSLSRPTVKGTSLTGLKSAVNQPRNPSLASSVSSSRTPSVISRHTSTSSFSSSVGPGYRPKSAFGSRPNTAMSNGHTRAKTSITKPRPQRSADPTESDDEMLSGGKRNGMDTVSLIPCPVLCLEDSALENRKVRALPSTLSLTSLPSSNNLRDVSVSTAMSRLTLYGEEPDPTAMDQARSSTTKAPFSRHKYSFSTGFGNGRMDTGEGALVLYEGPDYSSVAPKTPSHIPVDNWELARFAPETPSRLPIPSPQKRKFVSRDSNTTGLPDFKLNSRLEQMEAMYNDLKSSVAGAQFDRSSIEETVAVYKSRYKAETQFNARKVVDDISRNHRSEVDKIRRDNTEEIDRLLRMHRDELREAERKVGVELDERVRDLERRNDSKLEEERTRRLREVQELESQIATGHHSLKVALQMKDQEIQILKQELEDVKTRLEREQEQKEIAQKSTEELRQTLQKAGTENTSTIGSLESTIASLRAHISFLESGSKAQSDSFVEMEGRLQEALAQREISQQKLIKEETLRRILFNQVQELKGNIRVMCRVRPTFKEGAEGACANISYPDTDKESKELTIMGKEKKSSFGNVTRETHSFSFDRVFGPSSQNQEVFEEISQLVQSALDGYNVCIFCYGQTGAGKTHTMSSADGMIPRATHQIYETATSLKEKGWTYTMEGSFVEVYNEEIHDLLGSSKDFEKKKHEIRHDDAKKQTTITGLRKVELDSPNAVEALLKQADNNRSVAATKSNERSSRSHSVFILKLVGRNSTTNETSEGTLNLVDLAGSERLKVSGAEGERMKETQNINKSLSCLGDVIGALGQGKEGTHIPYRNSKVKSALTQERHALTIS